MTTDPQGERRQDDVPIVLYLRLLVDRQGQVVEGEVGGSEDDQDARHGQRFHGPAGLLGAVQACLAAAREAKPHGEHVEQRDRPGNA